MSTYDITQTVPAEVITGDILNCPYSGAGISITLPPGRYKLEVWGAQGGSYGTTSTGGKGGYSVGTVTLNEEATLHLYAGGAGTYSTTSASFVSGGFNGGGKAGYWYGGSGGGGSDIRLGTDSLYSRIIVAGGGGGGWGYSNYNGGYGGGSTGGTGTGYSSSYYGQPGTQTAGGASVNYSAASSPGTFGQGGNSAITSSSYNRSSGGGGGWYGGGGTSYRSSSSKYRYGGAGAGGGSGYVYTSASAGNYPSGCLLNSAYYLADASTTAGNSSFASPTGTSETGHSGNGYCRITATEVFPQGPDTPTNFRQTLQDWFELALAWDAPADATGYKLYRDGTLISTQTETTYTDTTVEPNGSYLFSLIAYNADGESDPAKLTATTLEGVVIKVFEISGAEFSPNPAGINEKTDLSVLITEGIKILEPYYYYSGDLNSGEV